MGFIDIVLLAVGLSMDTMAVAAVRGLAAKSIRWQQALRVALVFGGVQGLFPLAGYLVGTKLGPVVQAWDHWIAFVLLSGIGAKMLWEARGSGDDEQKDEDKLEAAQNAFDLRLLVVLAVATSIDALPVGVTLPMMRAPIATTLLTIFVTTASLSAIGVYLGARFGAALGRRLDAFGGVVLIALGLKILLARLG